MVRELLNNVKQYARVLHARVEVSCENRRLRITVSDTGCGFDPQTALTEAAGDSRLGLFSIRERLKLFSGDLTIESAPGQGTRITVMLPVDNY